MLLEQHAEKRKKYIKNGKGKLTHEELVDEVQKMAKLDLNETNGQRRLADLAKRAPRSMHAVLVENIYRTEQFLLREIKKPTKLQEKMKNLEKELVPSSSNPEEKRRRLAEIQNRLTDITEAKLEENLNDLVKNVISGLAESKDSNKNDKSNILSEARNIATVQNSMRADTYYGLSHSINCVTNSLTSAAEVLSDEPVNQAFISQCKESSEFKFDTEVKNLMKLRDKVKGICIEFLGLLKTKAIRQGLVAKDALDCDTNCFVQHVPAFDFIKEVPEFLDKLIEVQRQYGEVMTKFEKEQKQLNKKKEAAAKRKMRRYIGAAIAGGIVVLVIIAASAAVAIPALAGVGCFAVPATAALWTTFVSSHAAILSTLSTISTATYLTTCGVIAGGCVVGGAVAVGVCMPLAQTAEQERRQFSMEQYRCQRAGKFLSDSECHIQNLIT